MGVEVPEKGRGAFETSGFLCAAFPAAWRSRPRSSRRLFSMAWTSSLFRRGWPQKVHGPSPSLAQMILPQERQLGAADNKA